MKNSSEFFEDILNFLEKNSEEKKLFKTLESLVDQLNFFYQQRWKRHLPLAESLTNRWKKAKLLGFGEGTSIYDSSLVIGKVTVGQNTWIGPNTILDGSGGLEIGDNCSISAGVQIYSHDSVCWALSGGLIDPQRAPTKIGSNCYIGPNVVIAKGITIGNYCVIGANSLVLDDIPDYSKAFGTPCRIKGKVDIPNGKN